MDEVYDFGVILQKLRKEKGFTQEQLARLIHKESSIISRYEKGLQNPTFETVKEFAAIFNVSMDYLAGMEKHSNISTFGMNPEQIAITKNLIEVFRKKNISTFQKNGCRTLPDYRKDCGRVIKGQIKYPDKSALQLRFVGIYFLSNFFTVSHSYFPHTYTISAYTASLAHNLNIFSKP